MLSAALTAHRSSNSKNTEMANVNRIVSFLHPRVQDGAPSKLQMTNKTSTYFHATPSFPWSCGDHLLRSWSSRGNCASTQPEQALSPPPIFHSHPLNGTTSGSVPWHPGRQTSSAHNDGCRQQEGSDRLFSRVRIVQRQIYQDLGSQLTLDKGLLQQRLRVLINVLDNNRLALLLRMGFEKGRKLCKQLRRPTACRLSLGIETNTLEVRNKALADGLPNGVDLLGKELLACLVAQRGFEPVLNKHQERRNIPKCDHLCQRK